MKHKCQVFQGVNFYETAEGYYRSSPNFGGKRIHRAVWEHYYGPIPKGYCIHHRDGDKGNNALSNLELLPAGKHSTLHNVERLNSGKGSSDNYELWFGTNAFKNRKLLQENEKSCINCGKMYKAVYGSHRKFCSNACKAAYRRKLGVDNEERECVICGKKFVIDKNKKTRTCSLKCRGKLISISNKRRNFRSII